MPATTRRRYAVRPVARGTAIAANTILVVVALSAVGGLLMSRAALTQVDAITIPDTTDFAGRGIAALATQAWVDGEAPPIAVPSEYQPAQFAVTHTEPVWAGGTKNADGSETHTFVLSVGARWTNVAVTVDLTTDGWTMIGVPTLTPHTPSAADGTGQTSSFPNPGNSDTDLTITDSVAEQIGAWATAYATGDTQTLRRLAGDGTGRQYPSLGGYTTAEATVIDAVATSVSDAQVRVLVDMTGPDGEVSAMYDLALANTDTSLPSVRDWRPSGSSAEFGDGTAAGAVEWELPTTTTSTTTVDSASATTETTVAAEPTS